jgi:hypothetical protein
MIGTRFVVAVALMLLASGVARAGFMDPPKPEVLARAEDQERARLLSKPCAKADEGHGCYRFGGRLWREAPCTEYVDAQTLREVPTDQCYKMDPPRRFRGIWIDEFEGQAFIPEGATPPEWPRGERQSPGWQQQFDRAQAASIWLDVDRVNLGHEFNRGSRKLLIDFIGRKTTYTGAYGHMGMSGNEIIVDRVISVKPVE